MRLFFAASLVLLLAACGRTEPSGPPSNQAATREIPFRPDGTLDLMRGGEVYRSLDIEVAATDSARARGLMERAPLTDEQGMLFVFDFAGPQTFWMASTPSSLDILFIGADSTVVNIAKYTRPFSTDGVSSTGPARFVLETAAGFTDRYDVAPGDRVRWHYPAD